MNAVLKLLRNLAEQKLKVSITTSSYRSSGLFCIALMCGQIPLNYLEIIHLTNFIMLNFIS